MKRLDLGEPTCLPFDEFRLTNTLYTGLVKRRVFLRNFLLGGLAVPPLTLGGAYAQAMSFEISKHQVRLPLLEQPIKIAHLTDLHFAGAHGLEHVKKWVEATLWQKPDVVLITGDLVHGDIFKRLGDKAKPMLEAFALALKPLSAAPLGAFACLGNHDYALRWSGTASVSDLKNALEKNNIPLLVNASRQLRSDVYLGSLDDLWHGRPNLEKTLQGIPTQKTVLLMSHNPDVLPTLPKQVSIMLSGHTHGGQVRLPFFGALASVTEHGERYQQGFIEETTLGFVSRGLGTGTIPIRLFCPAELVLLECVPA